MAVSAINIDATTPLGRMLVAGGSGSREFRRKVEDATAAFVHLVDGNGTDVSHFNAVVGAGKPFATNAEAKASWDETQSLNAVLENAEAAMLQWCAKHGV